MRPNTEDQVPSNWRAVSVLRECGLCLLWLAFAAGGGAYAQIGGGNPPGPETAKTPGETRAPVVRKLGDLGASLANKAEGLPVAGSAVTQGAIVSLREALAKAARCEPTALPGEFLWNDIALPHVHQEPWHRLGGMPLVGPLPPLASGVMLWRDKLDIHDAPCGSLQPRSVRPPFLYLPVPVARGPRLMENPAFDSPHFRIVVLQAGDRKGDTAVTLEVAARLLAKLEDSLALVRMLPVEVAKARPRDVPLKTVFILEAVAAAQPQGGRPATVAAAAMATSGYSVKLGEDDETVTIPVPEEMILRGGKDQIAFLERALVIGLAAYLFGSSPVHPVIQEGLAEMLAIATPVPPDEKEPRDRQSSAERRLAKDAERQAEQMARQVSKELKMEISPPTQRVYDLGDPRSAFLKLEPRDYESYQPRIMASLARLAGGRESNSSSGQAGAGGGCRLPIVRTSQQTGVSPEAIITCYLLFGDNDGDPVHLRNYFESLRWFGSDELARKRLLYGRKPAALSNDIVKWLSNKDCG